MAWPELLVAQHGVDTVELFTHFALVILEAHTQLIEVALHLVHAVGDFLRGSRLRHDFGQVSQLVLVIPVVVHRGGDGRVIGGPAGKIVGHAPFDGCPRLVDLSGRLADALGDRIAYHAEHPLVESADSGLPWQNSHMGQFAGHRTGRRAVRGGQQFGDGIR